MEWPHDPDGEEGSEGGRKYGQAVFAKKLAGEDFPVDRDACIDHFGDHPIRLDHERIVPAVEILERLPDGEFDDKPSLLAAIGRAMREGDFWTFESGRYAPR